MLEINLFEEQWRIMTRFFKREPDSAIKDFYYAALSEELTDQQFQAISQKLLKTCVRFPLIAEFLALKPASIMPVKLPENAVPLDTPRNFSPTAWATAVLALPNHPRWGDFKRRARQILGDVENAQ
jgi:hypothetical protein